MARSEQPARPVSVLFLHSATLPPLGADTWVHAQIMRSLDRSAHIVHAACAPGREGHPSPTYEVLRNVPGLHLVPVNLGPEVSIQRSGWAKFRSLAATVPAAISFVRLARYVRRHKIDVIHTSDRPRDAAAAVVLARLTGAKSVIHAHVAFGDWMSRLLKWSMPRADAMIAISEFVKGSLAASGHSSATTYVVLNAIDACSWHPREGRSSGREEVGADDDTPVVITVCRLFPGKGPGELIRALAAVRRDHPTTRLLVVGEDVTPAGTYARELALLARELGVAEAVTFTGRRPDVPMLMAASDLFAMPSLEEPFGLVYLEAMAMELPVVSLDSGGTPEVVEDGRSGLLSRPGDTRALVANISALLSDAALRGRLGTYGRRQVVERFTLRRQACDVANVYRTILWGAPDAPVRAEGAKHASAVAG